MLPLTMQAYISKQAFVLHLYQAVKEAGQADCMAMSGVMLLSGPLQSLCMAVREALEETRFALLCIITAQM
jgi:hypothetical protein